MRKLNLLLLVIAKSIYNRFKLFNISLNYFKKGSEKKFRYSCCISYLIVTYVETKLKTITHGKAESCVAGCIPSNISMDCFRKNLCYIANFTFILKLNKYNITYRKVKPPVACSSKRYLQPLTF